MKLLLVAMPRSGSTLIAESIEKSFQVKTIHEPFNYPAERIHQGLDYVPSPIDCMIDAITLITQEYSFVKHHIMHPFNARGEGEMHEHIRTGPYSPANLLRMFARTADYVIVLQRDWEWIFSAHLAETTGKWSDDQYTHNECKITFEEARAKIQEWKLYLAYIREFINAINVNWINTRVHVVNYEADDWLDTIQEICQKAFDKPYTQLQLTERVRQRRDKYAVMFDNYLEISSML